MGMEMSHRRITSEELEYLQKYPEGGKRFLYGVDEKEIDNWDAYEMAFQNHLYELKEKGRLYSVEKDWETLHFLLTGKPIRGEKIGENQSALEKLIVGGNQLNFYTDFGCVKYLTSEEVKAISRELEGIAIEELKGWYNVEAFNKAEIYPARACWNGWYKATLLINPNSQTLLALPIVF